MELEEGELHVWRHTVNEHDYLLEKTSPLLSKQEHERCDAYLRESDKIRYTCNHRCVRQVLSRYTGIPPAQIVFSRAAMGKPFIKNSNLFFSYSYRGNLGLLAVSRQSEVGIDIEKMRPLLDLHTFAEFCFSKKEKDIIFKSPAGKFDETLFTFWTFKEAIIKLLGVGLNTDLTQIDLSDFFYSELNILSSDNHAYTIKSIKAAAGYMAAIAVKGRLNKCLEFDF